MDNNIVQNNVVVIEHYCEVCNRGFDCAEALGGHMRTDHGMGSDPYNNQDNNNNNNNNKHSYFLRAKTPRSFEEDDDGVEYNKITSKSVINSSEEEEEEEEEQVEEEEEDLANCLVMLSSSSNKSYIISHDQKQEENNKGGKQLVEKGMFQCKACKKVFNSHQALGGHRASHKKVKGCFAAKLLDEQNNQDNSNTQQDEHHPLSTPLDNHRDSSEETQKQRPCNKTHECSVCRRVFSSGQALGGHKRCHWLTTSSDNAFIPSFHYDQTQQQLLYNKPDLNLNLNLNLKLENESTRLYLQEWATNNNNTNQNQQIKIVNEKAPCEMKLRKLSDVNMDSGWLKVGIASTTDT